MERQWPHNAQGLSLSEVKTHEVTLIGEEIDQYCNETRKCSETYLPIQIQVSMSKSMNFSMNGPEKLGILYEIKSDCNFT